MCVLHYNHITCYNKLQTSKRFVQTTFLLSQTWFDFRHTGVNNDNLLSYLTDIWADCNQNSCTLDPCVVLSLLYCAFNIYFTMRS